MQHLINIADSNFKKYNSLASTTSSIDQFNLMMLYMQASNYWFKMFMNLSLPTIQNN
ncbi:MAG: hypothetical protein V4651_08250 [Bacteroidota bacterium]